MGLRDKISARVGALFVRVGVRLLGGAPASEPPPDLEEDESKLTWPMNHPRVGYTDRAREMIAEGRRPAPTPEKEVEKPLVGSLAYRALRAEERRRNRTMGG